MSTDIQPGKIPGSITTTNHRQPKAADRQSGAPGLDQTATKSPATDTVSITDKVTRLQEIEKRLADIPAINDKLVTEFRQTLANGNLEIDLDRIASKLIEIETGVTDNSKR